MGQDEGKRRIHMIGNAHLDPVWLWCWDEGWQEAAATFESALELLDEFPDLVVTRGESSLYEWLAESHPDLIEKVKERVRSGRWEIVGGWVVQSDTNLPCGEALIRQALLGKAYFRRAFGVDVEVAYCVDSFGHAATLPQILAGCGYRYFTFMRPMKHEKDLPSNLFRWRGPDGSEVLAFRIPVAYQTTDVPLAEHFQNVLAELPAEVESGMCFYGVGDHGGGPTREQIASLRRLQQGGPHTILFSRCDRFFAEVEPHRGKLPVVADELQNHAVGCYSVVSAMKRMNRRTEAALLDAETLSGLAWVAGAGREDRESLRDAWRTLLFNQFHDILPGSAIRTACRDALEQLGGARQRALHVRTAAVRRLARRVAVRPPEDADWRQSLVVFNPTGIARREIVRCTPWMFWDLAWRNPDHVALADGEGRRFAAQRVFSEKCVGRRGIRQAFALPADVPPYGCAAYHLIEETWGGEIENPARCDGLTLTNGVIEATVDARTGALAAIRRCNGDNFLLGPARHEIVSDTSDTWGHHVVCFGEAEGAFEPAADPLVVYAGPLTAEIRTESRWGEARLIQEFSLDAGADFLTLRCCLHWRGYQKLVRFALPLRASGREGHHQTTAEAPHGHTVRPRDGCEYPMLRWVDMAGLTVANDAKYSYRAKENTLGITVLRSPAHAHHAPHTPAPERRLDVVDQGEQRYAFRLRPHGGACDPAAAFDLAEALNRPLIVNAETVHDGDLGTRGSLLPLAFDPGLRPVALKRAEEAERLVLRVLDVAGDGGRVRTPDGVVLATLRPCQLLTVSLNPANPADAPVVLDHIERVLS